MRFVSQSCPILYDPMDCNPPGSSVHGDSPGKNTGVVAMASSRGSSQPSDRTQVSHIAGEFFTLWATREAPGANPKDHLLARGSSQRGTGHGGPQVRASAQALFPSSLSRAACPPTSPSPWPQTQRWGTPCLSELCKLPFLINIDIENTFIAM